TGRIIPRTCTRARLRPAPTRLATADAPAYTRGPPPPGEEPHDLSAPEQPDTRHETRDTRHETVDLFISCLVSRIWCLVSWSAPGRRLPDFPRAHRHQRRDDQDQDRFDDEHGRGGAAE